VVVHTCNSSYWGSWGRRIWFKVSPGKKIGETPSPQTSWAWWHVPVMPVLGKHRLEDQVQGWHQAKSMILSEK
jgi:hypothetical protein